MGRWNDELASKRFEKMEIAVPATLEIKASGTAIGEMYMFGSNKDLYVATRFQQKFELITFVEMMKAYWVGQGREVESMIVNMEDSDIMIYLKALPAVPRG